MGGDTQSSDSSGNGSDVAERKGWFDIHYVSKKGGRAARTFQYKGKDTSLLYKYALSPLAEACVQRIPMWLAPNLITSIGMIAVVVSHIILAIASPNFDADGPRWIFPFAGLSLFFYATLDNMDGKQARRTGSSSALGLLFDHGCDSINAGLLSATCFMACVGTGPTWFAVLCWLLVIFPFYFASWEEFHLDEFILPIINGPSEGIHLNVVVYIVMYWIGPHALRTDMAFGLQWYQFFTLLPLGAAALTCINQTYKVYVSEKKHGRSFIHAFGRMVPVLFITAVLLSWCHLSPSMMRHHMRLLFLILGSAFSDAVMKLMLAHVCSQRYMPNIIVMATLILGPLNAAFPFMDELLLMYCLLILHGTSLAIFCYVTVNDLMVALGVNCFTIPPAPKK